MVAVSVVIVSRNGGRTLGDALASLADQRFDGAWEIVLADNGSTDDTRTVFERFRARRPDLAARAVDASGPASAAHARNVGVRVARGDRILFLDDDDAASPGWLAAMARALDRGPFVSSRWECRKLNDPDVYEARREEAERPFPRLPFPPHCRLVPTGAMGMRRAVFDAVGGFDVRCVRLADLDFCVRAARCGHQAVEAPGAVYHYRFRPSPADAYAQFRAYGLAWKELLLRNGFAARRFSAAGWLAHGAAYLRLGAWRAARLHRPLRRVERYAFAMRRGHLDGATVAAWRHGTPPDPSTPADLARRLARRLGLRAALAPS
jgi:glycosyltransferase involved in cell wall biosynthesis